MATATFVVTVTLVVGAFICTKAGVESAENRVSEQKLLNDLLGTSYDKNIRPAGSLVDENVPTIVNVNMYARSITDVDHINMQFSTQLTFRMQWLDPRLAFSGKKDADKLKYLTLKDSSRIWIPDLFFSNEVSGHQHDLMTCNTYVRIFPNGEVLYSSRISLTLSCPMVLKLFPFDKQTCSIRMASYGYTTDDIIFKWKNVDPVQITPELYLSGLSLHQFQTDHCDSQTNTGTYSCLRVDFLFGREFKKYLKEIYIPCTMLIIIAWLTLWLEHYGPGANGRLLAGIVTLLVMTLLIQNLEESPVSYTRKIDVWTGICLTFVFSTVVEFVIVNFMARIRILNSNEGDIKSRRSNFLHNVRDWKHNGGEIIDIITRIAYPIAFFLFAIIYFASTGN